MIIKDYIAVRRLWKVCIWYGMYLSEKTPIPVHSRNRGICPFYQDGEFYASCRKRRDDRLWRGRRTGSWRCRSRAEGWTYFPSVCPPGFAGEKGLRRLLLVKCADTRTMQFALMRMTVNASVVSTEAYHHMGFRDLAPVQEKNGIRFVPMDLMISPAKCKIFL